MRQDFSRKSPTRVVTARSANLNHIFDEYLEYFFDEYYTFKTYWLLCISIIFNSLISRVSKIGPTTLLGPGALHLLYPSNSATAYVEHFLKNILWLFVILKNRKVIFSLSSSCRQWCLICYLCGICLSKDMLNLRYKWQAEKNALECFAMRMK